MDYLDMYKMILEIIAQKDPKDFQEILDDSQHYQIVKNYIASEEPNQFLIQNMENTTIGLINDGLISGIISPLKYVTLIKINGLTISGFQYLKKLQKEDTANEIKAILKSNNQAITPETLTKALSQLVF